MSRLPQLRGDEVVAALKRAGWAVRGQRGSHVVLVRAGSIYSLSVPLHDRVGRGLLHDLIRKAGLSDDEFLELL
ncbi:MAG: type II toxin-antitoxin system HicA family toxin [Armatimonadia bacterium]